MTDVMIFERLSVQSLLALALLLGTLAWVACKLVLKKNLVLERQFNRDFALTVKGKSLEGSDFACTFPPSRRQAIINELDAQTKPYQMEIPEVYPKDVTLKSCQLPMALTPDLDQADRHTPTGLSTTDIKKLGSFPNYSLLSGVPHPTPCPSFDINTAEFRPFRPFRFAYHQTMSLQKFEPDYWVELEKNYFQSLEQRKQLLERHGHSILNHSPGSELACRELMEMVLQYLCIRYPNQFALTDSNTVFVNRLLNNRTSLNSEHPLNVLFDHVPEDFAIMMRNEKDGMYYLRAGFICSSIGWTFGTHFQRQLREIHTEVNDYADKMAKSMDRYFSKLPTDQPIQRGAWFVEDWKPLFVTPEEYALNAGTRHQGEQVGIDQCYLRVDWQTLRRLPLSGAIVFNFKAIFTPMTELRDEPFVPSLLYKQVTAGKPLLTEPKIHKHIRPIVLGALQTWKEEQIAKGLIPSDWNEETLAESPFYPGWKNRWRQKIGFEL